MTVSWAASSSSSSQIGQRRAADWSGFVTLIDPSNYTIAPASDVRFVSTVPARLLGADSEHDDVVQESFLQIIAGVHRVRDAAALPRWVVAVTVNTVRTHLRRRRVRRVVMLVGGELPQRVAPPDDHIARRQL